MLVNPLAKFTNDFIHDTLGLQQITVGIGWGKVLGQFILLFWVQYGHGVYPAPVGELHHLVPRRLHV